MSFAGFIYCQFIHYPPAPTASFSGRTVIATGSNAGLGLVTCRSLVRLGASRVILACRNLDKGHAAVKDIQESTSCLPETLRVWSLDMSSYASVIDFANRVKAEFPRLDALIANAGLDNMTFRITEGNEEMITNNVVSTALLGCLLLPKLRETALELEKYTHFTYTASELYDFSLPKGPLGACTKDGMPENPADSAERAPEKLPGEDHISVGKPENRIALSRNGASVALMFMPCAVA